MGVQDGATASKGSPMDDAGNLVLAKAPSFHGIGLNQAGFLADLLFPSRFFFAISRE